MPELNSVDEANKSVELADKMLELSRQVLDGQISNSDAVKEAAARAAIQKLTSRPQGK